MRGLGRHGFLTLLALAALLVGCASEASEKNSYVHQVNQAQKHFATTVTRVSTAITPTSSARDDRRTLGRFEAAIDGIVGDLRRIEVPARVRREHARLVSAMSGFGTDVHEANVALRKPDRRTLAEAQRHIARATATVNVRINAAIRAINDRLKASS